MNMENDSIVQEILERLVRLETKIDNYNGLREKVDDTSKATEVQQKEIEQQKERLNKMEDNLKWLWRTIAGALIVAFLAANIYFK